MEQHSEVVFSLTAEETKQLKDGVNLVNRSEKERLIIFKDPTAENTEEEPATAHMYKACLNRCKHQGGTFIKDIEDGDNCVLRCTKHGWKLDAKTMRYVNPPDSFSQEQLVPELNDDGSLSIVELKPPQPWETDKRPPAPLRVGEVQITYFTHACIEMKLGGVTMFTDPWLTGPAFARGWWLMHEPPSDWLDRLSKADLIYISHLHSDHLNYPTLELLSERNPDIPIYVGDTSMPVFVRLKQSGVKLNNINIQKFGRWIEINKDTRFMILMDGVHPDMDTCLLVDYKGHLILNTVDCTNPNGGRLPTGVDLMLSDFAGGASGFPMTFSGGKYTEEWKAQFVKRERRKLLYYKMQLVRDVSPVIYCPFAGYFVEAHPSDHYIKSTNIKNDPDTLNRLIKKYSPHIKTWSPSPGAVLDLQKAIQGDSDYIQDPPAGTKKYKDSWNFEKYINEINRNIEEEIFAYPEWIEFYYRWTGFKNYNLVIRMIERGEDFQPIPGSYDFMVDFVGEEPAFPTERPTRDHSYIEMENRICVHRETVKKGLFWDNLYIGFCNRISREPDTFHYLFWNHMQIHLPKTEPDWDGFLKDMKTKGAPRKDIWKPSLESTSTNHHIQGNGITGNGTHLSSNGLGNHASTWDLPPAPNGNGMVKHWLGPLMIGVAALGVGVALWKTKAD
ncbi:cytidine monophosphate-N-acetylneuraminic acid hydroxylase-like [Patiria miniata]|uniref:Cytidine monophosphate-N-acetylneuraminic acid hydroxylase n=1 Tax=Patiria miniata TaxID=46514 RepID=A0A913YYW1_PATMI|nr:cytidine monophosphate-N-acetylneuraminic acid hydroxylase-like [Patiria miniata]XP_038044588.1 cytidine monophosphate-N-acetylneuraminic acid hydroxylase-like [Patiria miniata]